MTYQSTRLGVDIGGTFTDLVLETPTGRFSTKVLTTYAAPEDAIITGMHRVCAQAGVGADTIDQIIHGTTLATNALIERRGAKTAFITTEGFRDVIEMRSESRFEQYDLNLQLPPPLLPRQMRYTVGGRVDAQGDVLVEIDPDEVAQVVERIALAGFESVAVGFIHAYLNPRHEEAVRDILHARLPDVSVSISSEVSPQMREYERFNTVVANAYIKPLMASYLGRLETRLAAEGATGSVFLMHSGGGIISIRDAAEFPVRLVESGPAGGAVFAAHIAARYGLDRVLSFDMGGTTAKICLIRDGAPKTSRVFEVARSYRFKKGSGMPISIPVIDMVEIGAGGGSLAHVDSLNQIRVGPESAGSEPGPASYGRGGTRPAVTDADLVLGKLDADNFAGGAIPLDPGAADAALRTHVGGPLSMDATEAAFGLAEVVDENMANAARVHAVENGEDLGSYTMVAFGGAAPLHAARLCEKLGVARLIVPPGAGVGSAIGFLRAPFSFEATRSVYMKLAQFDPDRIRTLLGDLKAEAEGFVRSCDGAAAISCDYKVYMRYSGQGWEIPVPLSLAEATDPRAAAFAARFDAAYSRLFGRTVAGMDVEITVWAVNASTPSATPEPSVEAPNAGPAPIAGTRPLFDAVAGRFTSAQIVARDGMQPGHTTAGPAAITEAETTTIVPEGRRATCQSDGCLDIRTAGDTP